MKKKHVFLLVVLILTPLALVNTYALNYTITFTGTGAITSVDSVIVQNLTRNTLITVPTGNVLNLTDLPNAVELLNADDETIHVYQDSNDGYSTISFYTKEAGKTQINAYSLDGKKIVETSTNLQEGVNSFKVSLPIGVFVIHVSGNGYKYTTKAMNQKGTLLEPKITYIGSEKLEFNIQQKSKSNTLGITKMNYSVGDRLLYKGISSYYRTIVVDVPKGSKTMNFDFVQCKDVDGNSYSVVKINNQTWMAENLRTSKYRNGVPLTNMHYWKNYNEDTDNDSKYGKLYDWYTVADNQNIAPSGWHVPRDSEWADLENYISSNLGTSPSESKSLASTTTDWVSSATEGNVGYDLTTNNNTGFSALPTGYFLYYQPYNGYYYFNDLKSGAYWWSSTEHNPDDAFSRNLLNNSSYLIKGQYFKKNYGFSVRCIRDSQ